jgi:hypothetical protein
MTLTLHKAEKIFEEASRINSGAWVKHSRNVAAAARVIARKDLELEEEKAYIFGLLHDIGRHKYLSGMNHILEGYNFLMEKGYEEAARICMTHTFAFKDVNAIYGKWDSLEDMKIVEKYINSIRYNEYDLLIQLCDSLALPNGFALIEKRFVETALRSGINNLTLFKWKSVLNIKKYFEDKIGCPIYALLPNIVQNTFGKLEV